MLTLLSPHVHEQEIKRSRFIATAGPVANEDGAKAFIAARSVADATHNCWAWRIGQTYRFGDDGEPSGTAGKPILQAIDGQELDGIAVVVTRWFGGILLGSGGLVRAYGGTASLCLRAAHKELIVPSVEVRIGIAFSDLALVRAKLFGLPDVQLMQERFTGSGAILTVSLPATGAEEALTMVTDLTSGRARIHRGPQLAAPD